MEHRWGIRIPADLQVHLVSSQVSTRFAHLRNVSLSGALVQAGFPIKPLTLIQVNLTPHLQPLAAYVVWTDLERVGLEWCDFAPPAIMQLMRQLSQPDCSSLADQLSELPTNRQSKRKSFQRAG